MRKVAVLLCVLLVASLTVLIPGPASGGGALGPRIAGLSHEHPTGQNFSYLCGKFRGVAGRRYLAIAAGPGLMDDPKVKFQLPSNGPGRVEWAIDSPGMYTVKMRRPGSTRILDRASYSVPAPPPEGAAVGPFRCSTY